MAKFLALLFILIAIGVSWFWINFLSDLPPPDLDPNPYWGPSEKKGQKHDTSIRLFRIDVDNITLLDLKTKLTSELSLDMSRFVQPLETIGFQYGFNTNYLQRVGKYWLEKYDWKTREKLLNKYPHFKITIFGLDLHFQHIKSQNNSKYRVTRPLLILHGWPGSFVEFQQTIPLLIEPKDADLNFEVVIPSLPGYGFSEGPYQPGLGPVEIAQVLNQLMKRLGHQKYYIQGGDWGSLIGNDMASLYPENVQGLHVNFCASLGLRSFLKVAIASIYPPLFMTSEEAELAFPLFTIIEESGYLLIQSTKPDTVGVGLSQSPTALLAYILEKFSTWSNKEWKNESNGGLESHFNLDDLLDNVMIYWATNSMTSSMRLFAEAFNFNQLFGHNIDRVPIKVPAACLQPPKEVYGGDCRWVLKDRYHNLQRYNIASKGGHFLALEEPQIFSNDILDFFDSLEKSNKLNIGI